MEAETWLCRCDAHKSRWEYDGCAEQGTSIVRGYRAGLRTGIAAEIAARNKNRRSGPAALLVKAGERGRTHDIHVGNVTLYH